MTSPFKLTKIYQGLTSKNQLLKRKLKMGTDEIPIPPKRNDVTITEAINRFTKANPRVDTTNLKPLSVKHSNVGETDEGVIQGAFDTATREAQQSGYPAPNYEKFKSRYLKRNMKADGGMLVQPSDDGSRPGYAKEKPLNNTELKIFNNYLKARKNMKLAAPTDENKMKIKSKVRVGDIDNNTIKNMKEKYRYENVNQQLRYDTKLKRWEKTINKNKNYIQKAGETKTQFLKRVESIASKAQTIARKKQDVATSKTRTYIDNWTRDWLDNNLEKYGVRKFDKMTNDLKNDWKKQIKNLDIDKGFVQNLSTKSGLPNVTAIGKNAFNYNNIPFYTSAETTKTPLTQWRNLFFKNKIDSSPEFKKKILDYFDFINTDKRGLYNSPGGQTIKAYKDIVDKDVIYLLSPDANLKATSKYNLFNSFDDNFSEAYNNYTRKVNRSIQWRTSATTIEKALGLIPNSIKNSMDKEKTALAKIFDVKQLPPELRYTLEHAQGISAAAKTGDKTIMQTAVNDLIGTTIKQNKALGFGGFEANRNALVRDIIAGVNVDDNLKSLNSLSRNAYKDFGIKGNIYSLKDGKLTTSSISPALTQEERFSQYFKELDKTKEGSAAIKKQAGSLKNLIASFGGGTCSVFSGKKATLKADGGRIGLQAGTPNIDDCFKSGSAVINSGKVPVDKADDFAQLLKRAGNIGRGIMKYGIIPEALYATADSLVRMGMGDTFKEAGFRATDYILPGDQTKAAEISKVSRIFGDETGELVARTIDYKNQLAKIKSLEDQKANFENLSGGGEFDYIGDLSGDVKNTDKQLIQAKNDLDNKFKISEAEQLFAERKQEEAYDASSANSPFTKLKARFRDSSDGLSDIETLGAPEKTQMQLNLDMLPTVPRDYMMATDDQIINFVNKENLLRGEKQNPQLYIDERDKLKKDFMTKGPAVYGAEQVYGAQGIFSEPLLKSIAAKQNSIDDLEREAVGQRNKFNVFDRDTSGLGTGLRGFSAASGGIASLTKTIPPKSGPTPHGLRYVYNNVKKIKE